MRKMKELKIAVAGIPTAILYEGKDNMQSAEVVQKFAQKYSCDFTISQNSEITKPALFTPFDTTKAVKDFSEICMKKSGRKRSDFGNQENC